MKDIIFEKNKLKGISVITEEEIKTIQQFYDDNHTLMDCKKRFGHCKATLIKYLKTRPSGKIPQDGIIKQKRNVRSVISWRQRTKQKLVEYKGGKCKFCGYNKYIGNLTFHHLDPMKKDFSISGKTMAFEKLKKEVDKCELVCHNCHGEIHAGLINDLFQSGEIVSQTAVTR